MANKASDNGYNYPAFFRRSDRSIFRNSSLRAGTKAPDFVAETLDGKTFRLSDFLAKKNVVIEFGCSTCPPFIDSLCNDTRSFSKLYNKYKKHGFEFFIIYTRETHPGEVIKTHRTYREKRKHAEMLKDDYDVKVPILVDSLGGKIHRTFGMMPNMVYVINKGGTIIYRSEWFDYDELNRVLGQYGRVVEKRGRHARNWGYSEYVRPRAMTNHNFSKKVYLKAGKKALTDAKKVFSE